MVASVSTLLTEAVLETFRTTGHLLAWGDRFAAPFGLTSARWQMLGALALAGEALTTPRIAERMGVSRQGARKQLARLREEGLVRERPNPHHRRSPYFELTEAGARRYQEVDAAWQAHVGRISAGLPAADLDAALRVLRRLQRDHPVVGDGGEP